MKLVIDLQGAQSASRNRGIGRYSLALAEAMARQAGEHEIWIGLNGAFQDTIEPVRASFDTLVPRERIVVWETPTPVADIDPANVWRRRTGEILREFFLASLKPDMVHVTSLFEGLVDDAVTSVGAFSDGQATAVTLYDLIPLIYRDPYLGNPLAETWYQRKLGSLRRAGLWLAISESSRRDGIAWLNVPAHKVVNISTAAGTQFRPVRLSETENQALRQRYGLKRPFVMYTGGDDPRKNPEALIDAYARLPAVVRKAHQLAIVCPAQKERIDALQRHAKRVGLAKDELVMTGFVPDNDLVKLYNSCVAFCFPSWYEGFGLPALEAMQCGAAAIGANTSSIPEVIGRTDALFDPHDQEDMAARLQQVLTDTDYRQGLARHGLEQARKFSWDETARRAWTAFEAHYEELCERAQPRPSICLGRRPCLAYVSPLPPERSGIADYSAELLPELARHYNIDVIVDQPEVDDPWIRANCGIRDKRWFDEHAHQYDRTLYHFGNSAFHQYMFDLLERHPGIVVLHDFYLSGSIAHMDLQDGRTGVWPWALYLSHGYHAVQERYRAGDVDDVIWKYPANLLALRNAVGVIVHSEHSRHLARRFYGDRFPDDWTIIPHMRRVPQTGSRKAARKALGFGEDDFILCSFGLMAPTKLNHRLLRAWLGSRLARDSNCHLVFVGEPHGGKYGAELRRVIDESPAGKRIHITGWASPELFQQYLYAADAAVQLRTLSRGESSGTVLDCMAHALPTIANAHGSLAELPDDCVVMLPDEFADAELREAIESLWTDPERRKTLGERARPYINERHSPRLVADQYHAAIERYFGHSYGALKQRTVAALATVDPAPRDEQEWVALARAVSRNTPTLKSKRQLLVDISELVQRDIGTGIQRVVCSILKNLLVNPPDGFRVEPVYASPERPGYYYARHFTLRFLNCPADILEDAPVEFQSGDAFLGLDWVPPVVLSHADYYAAMRQAGVHIYFLIYDLLPISLPYCFPDGLTELHSRWLAVVGGHADGAICISRAVAEEFADRLKEMGSHRKRPLRIGWFHLGSDIENSEPTRGLPHDAEETLASLAGRPTFLMVGTIEPRKGYLQTLAAFDCLWRDGVDANLVIVGAEGWKPVPQEQRRTIPEIVQKLRGHVELGKRLFWLEGISDEYLENIYAASTCVIAASEGEGFGLPLVEAARHKIPVLVRDIRVFREVAGNHASYFSGTEPDDLVHAVKDWLTLYAESRHPKSDDMPWLTWAESVERLKAILRRDDHVACEAEGDATQLPHETEFRKAAIGVAGA